MGASVAEMVSISFQFRFVEYDNSLAAAKGSTLKFTYLLMAWNLYQIGYFSRKHSWVLHGCFLL